MRYAIYYAPSAHEPLAKFGAAWLGRSPEKGVEAEPGPKLPVDRDAWLRATAEPRRYGFHGTLKPPFTLAARRTEATLADSLAAFAAGRSAFDLPALALTRIGRFLALAPQQRCPLLHALADDCVRDFDDFRASPSPAELARRQANRLTSRQEAMLARWGYPYVLEEFRFHLTLTGALMPEELAKIDPAMRALYEPICRETWRVADLCLFVEPEAGAPFTVLRRFPLRSG